MKLLRYILITTLIVVITSCQATKFQKKDFVGKYKYRTNKLAYNFDYKLKLNTDTTFHLQISNQSCSGKWKPLSKYEIILKCNDVNTIEALSSGYLSQREYIIIRLKDASLKLTIYNSYLPFIPSLNQSVKKEEVILKKDNSVSSDLPSEGQ